MDQRFLELTFNANGPRLAVQVPTRGADAPPGYYMMFVFNEAGVPSVAKMVRVGIAANPNPAVTPTLATPAARTRHRRHRRQPDPQRERPQRRHADLQRQRAAARLDDRQRERGDQRHAGPGRQLQRRRDGQRRHQRRQHQLRLDDQQRGAAHPWRRGHARAGPGQRRRDLHGHRERAEPALPVELRRRQSRDRLVVARAASATRTRNRASTT